MKAISFNFDNVGGMSRLYLIDVGGLARVDTNLTDGRVRPVLASGARVYNIEVYGGEDFQFTEQMALEDEGETFNVSIIGFIPRMDNLVTVAELECGEWIAVHEDANGTVLMSGTREVPLRFVTSKSTGTPATRNATAFTLQATEPEPSRIVAGELLVLE